MPTGSELAGLVESIPQLEALDIGGCTGVLSTRLVKRVGSTSKLRGLVLSLNHLLYQNVPFPVLRSLPVPSVREQAQEIQVGSVHMSKQDLHEPYPHCLHCESYQ